MERVELLFHDFNRAVQYIDLMRQDDAITYARVEKRGKGKFYAVMELKENKTADGEPSAGEGKEAISAPAYTACIDSD